MDTYQDRHIHFILYYFTGTDILKMNMELAANVFLILHLKEKSSPFFQGVNKMLSVMFTKAVFWTETASSGKYNSKIEILRENIQSNII